MSHGGVVCFHGTRSMAGFDSGTVPDTPVADYAAGLAEMERNTGLIFGSCHGYYGAAMRSPIIDVGGTFLGILREPVKRVHSIFQANYAPLAALATAAGLDPQSARLTASFSEELSAVVSGTIDRRWSESTRRPRVQRAKSALSVTRKAASDPITDLGQAVGTLFFGAVRDTLAFDDELVRACQPAELIQMERMTIDPEYFREALWAQVVPARPYDAPRPADRGRVNDHLVAADREQTAESLFANWHPVFRQAFSQRVPSYAQAAATYRAVGYFVP